MTIGELVVKIAADTSAMRRDLAAARAEIEAFGASARGSSGDVEKLSKDTESLGGDVKKTRDEMEKWESHIPLVGGLFDKLNRSLVKAAGGLVGLIPGLEGIGESLANLAPQLAPFLSWIEFIPALAFTALFAVNALADGLGILLAVVGDLVAPLGLVAGLLGGLAAAFVIGAKKAADGGGKLQEFANKLATLKSMFGHTARELAGDFLPILNQLAGDAQHALLFIDKLAHMPLAQAMRTAAREGIPALQKFIDQMAHIVAKPIRLAIQIAFGTGKAGNEAASFVSNLWNQFQQFWLGYTRTKTLRFGNGRVLQITQQQVQGALQPFIDWFNRHDFTAQGMKIADGILNAIGKLKGPISTLLGNIIADAATKAMKQLLGIKLEPLFGPLKRAGIQAWDGVKKAAVDTFHYDAGQLKTLLGAAFLAVVRLGSAAWNKVKALAEGAWRAIGTIGHTEASSLAQVTTSLLGHAWGAVKAAGSAAWGAIRGVASGAVASIAGHVRGAISGAFHAIIGVARGVWNTIVGIFTAPLHINIDWPSIPSGLSGILHKIPGMATGGMVTPHAPVVVGERGPELFVPSGAGAIIPNHRAFGGGGGVTVVQVQLHNPLILGDRKTARDTARWLEPELSRIVKAAR